MQYLVQPLAPHSANGPNYANNQNRIFALSNASSGLAVTAQAQGVLMTHEKWDERDAQRWRLVPLGNNEFKIENAVSGLVLDVWYASHDEGANVVLWPWNGGANQRWRLIEIELGHFRIESVNSGKALTGNPTVSNARCADSLSSCRMCAAPLATDSPIPNTLTVIGVDRTASTTSTR